MLAQMPTGFSTSSPLIQRNAMLAKTCSISAAITVAVYCIEMVGRGDENIGTGKPRHHEAALDFPRRLPPRSPIFPSGPLRGRWHLTSQSAARRDDLRPRQPGAHVQARSMRTATPRPAHHDHSLGIPGGEPVDRRSDRHLAAAVAFNPRQIFLWHREAGRQLPGRDLCPRRSDRHVAMVAEFGPRDGSVHREHDPPAVLDDFLRLARGRNRGGAEGTGCQTPCSSRT